MGKTKKERIGSLESTVVVQIIPLPMGRLRSSKGELIKSLWFEIRRI